MPYSVREVSDQTSWDDIAEHQPQSVFLQSWAWGEFQKQAGRSVLRLGLFESDALIGIAQCVRFPLPFGMYYWIVSRGPVLKEPVASPGYAESMSAFLLGLKGRLSGLFVKIEPGIDASYSSIFLEVIRALKLRASSCIQPRDTRICSLAQSEEDLLSSAHQKTRYNINLAKRKGVIVHTGHEFIEDFVRLNHETTARDHFISHNDEYYRTMVRALPKDMITVYAAVLRSKVLAVHVVLHFGNTVTYLHGASSSQDRNVMAPHLLQWRQIQDAQRKKADQYDFWGVAPQARKSPVAGTWEGITRFKNGFPGKEQNYVGAYDLPIRGVWYSVYRIAKRLRSI